MEKIFKITTLGEFSIELEENVITDQANRSKKVWSLLEYLIVHRKRSIPQEELIDLLWPDGNSRDPVNTLKVLMHRVRSTLELLNFEQSRQMIVYSRGAYGWSQEHKCIVDIDEFERLIREADKEVEDTNRRVELLLQAESIYKGAFLQKNASEHWIVPISNFYRSLYGKVITDAARLLFSQKRYDELAQLCQRAVIFEPYDEQLYVYLIQALVHTGRSDKALEQYQYVSDLFFREFGITPSEELVSLYKDVIKTIKSPEMNLEIIKEKLEEHSELEGSFFCEYEFFKSVYHLEARSAARTGQAIYICLLTVTDINENSIPSQKVLNRVMDSLKITVQHTLRRGDIFTRYSLNQYLIMLPTTTYETSTMVLQRITKSYRKDHPNAAVILRYTTQPLTPAGLQ